jgi:hypothetical protein
VQAAGAQAQDGVLRRYQFAGFRGGVGAGRDENEEGGENAHQSSGTDHHQRLAPECVPVVAVSGISSRGAPINALRRLPRRRPAHAVKLS